MNPFRCHVPAAPGRPRETTLTPAQETRYIQLVQLANENRESGSASMAFRVLCDEFPEIGWKATDRASKHQLPAVARELARRANALVPLHRQGERGLRAAGAFRPFYLTISPGDPYPFWDFYGNYQGLAPADSVGGTSGNVRTLAGAPLIENAAAFARLHFIP